MAPAYFNPSLLTEGSTLLDYGCGDGWFLEKCKQRNVFLIGFEKARTLSENISKRLDIPIYSDPERLISDFQGKVDILTMHFVLEHLTDVANAFGHVQKLLRPGGTFFFTIPNINSWEARLFGKKWHGLDAPRHISFANPDCIKTLARKYGMKCTEVRSIPFPNGFAGSVPVVLTGRFNFLLYLCALPLGLALSRLAPSGFSAYSLKKKVQSTSGSAPATTHNPSNA
ncbi:MAG TPA: class I SAM-dependent methyltransferase [Verrucomicrobiae bacterium]|nr:class I SAM-dependent methyltransferase [Verrucomicrobiae bacterium]